MTSPWETSFSLETVSSPRHSFFAEHHEEISGEEFLASLLAGSGGLV